MSASSFFNPNISMVSIIALLLSCLAIIFTVYLYAKFSREIHLKDIVIHSACTEFRALHKEQQKKFNCLVDQLDSQRVEKDEKNDTFSLPIVLSSAIGRSGGCSQPFMLPQYEDYGFATRKECNLANRIVVPDVIEDDDDDDATGSEDDNDYGDSESTTSEDTVELVSDDDDDDNDDDIEAYPIIQVVKCADEDDDELDNISIDVEDDEDVKHVYMGENIIKHVQVEPDDMEIKELGSMIEDVDEMPVIHVVKECEEALDIMIDNIINNEQKEFGVDVVPTATSNAAEMEAKPAALPSLLPNSIADLRKLAKTMGITVDVSKMKKPELIALLRGLIIS